MRLPPDHASRQTRNRGRREIASLPAFFPILPSQEQTVPPSSLSKQAVNRTSNATSSDDDNVFHPKDEWEHFLSQSASRLERQSARINGKRTSSTKKTMSNDGFEEQTETESELKKPPFKLECSYGDDEAKKPEPELGQAQKEKKKRCSRKKLEAANKKLLKKNKVLQKEKKEGKAKLKESKKKLDQLSKDHQRMEVNMELLRGTIETMDATIETMEAKLKVTSEEKNQLHHDKEHLQAKVKEMSGQVEKVVALMTQLAKATTLGDTEGDGSSVAQESHRCIICMEEEASILVYPCGHLCMCPTCNQELAMQAQFQCPVCRANIQGTTKVYRS